MRVFQTVVDEGGFAAAARLLELSPPVVTRLVADLVASRAAGTLPRDGEWYNVPAPLNIQGVTATAGTDAGKNSVAASQSGRSTAAE